MTFAAIILAATATFPTLTQLHTGAPTLNPSPGVTSFTFVVAGDNRPAKTGDPLTQPVQDIIIALEKTPPALIVWNGDTISGKDASKAPGQYSQFILAFAGLSAPLFNAPGNHELVHDITCGTQSAEYPYQDVLTAYENAMSAPYGMFRYGNAAFVIVNTDDMPDLLVPGRCIYNGYVSKKQLHQLKATLAALETDATVTHTFLFMHRPIHDPGNSHQIGNGKKDTSAYNKQVEAFRRAIDHGGYKKLLFVFSSHDHLFDVYPKGAKLSGTSPGTGGEPTFVITGGAGAPLSGCTNPKKSGGPGSYYHYLSVAVAGANVTVTPVALYGTTPCTPPPAATLTPATGTTGR